MPACDLSRMLSDVGSQIRRHSKRVAQAQACDRTRTSSPDRGAHPAVIANRFSVPPDEAKFFLADHAADLLREP